MHTVVDLFSGAGGFLQGFIEAGFEPIFSVEKWEPAIKTHKRNYPNCKLIEKSIETISDEEIKEYLDEKKVDVVIGGPPCQGFSSIGKRMLIDPRNRLVFEFIRFVRVIKPKFFIMENVKGLLSAGNGKVKDIIIREFEKSGYKNIKVQVLCAADFGVPQMRQRVFFWGTRLDVEIVPEFPKPTHTKINYVTVGQSIMDLVGKENIIPNHIPMNHNKIVRERIKYIPEGEGLPENGVPEELMYGARSDFRNNKVKNFSHVYKRLDRSKPANTMVPGHNAFPLHPTENRALTVREAARIQTFDDSIIFEGNRQEQCIQVGNAVPVKLANALAKQVRILLD